MKFATKLLLLIIVAFVVSVGGWTMYKKQNISQSIDTFEDCVAAGNPIKESYPEQCIANGITYSNNKQTQDKKITIVGKLERIEPDCEPILAVDDSGNIIQLDEPVMCDGGSFIVVDGIRIMTAEGYPSNGNEEDVFRFDIVSAKPGDTVTVLFLKQTELTGTLDCEMCSLTIN